jgi:two-component system, chemotaxis family, CheB/CheR fusion protein
MGLSHIEELPTYLEFLRDNPREITALYKDLLIGVTSFFRESEAFQVLEHRVVPELVARATEEQPIRVWVPGCATGEEAYSIAILLVEAFQAASKAPRIQIFASDIDEESLEVARQGIYPESIASDVSPARIARFFVHVDEHHLQVAKLIREICIFAPQNLIGDAPFSRLDLVSCRNVLIYLEPDVQAKIISLFHFALKPDGYLLLGASETVGRHTDRFEPVSKKWRLYRRIGSTRRELVDIPIIPRGDRRLSPTLVEPPPLPRRAVEWMERQLLADHTPAAVLIDVAQDTLCYHGPVVDYLDFPRGEPTRNFLALARPGLRTRLRAAIRTAVREDRTVTDTDCRVNRGGAHIPCAISVSPLRDEKEAGLLLVTFRDRLQARASERGEKPIEESAVVRQLEQELDTTRADLQSALEEVESSNEEHKISNEEVLSMNEELQSANEELETSKEELQSLNEELSTVNSQLVEKVDELEHVKSDLLNLMNSTEIATIFLDADLRIQSFTPATSKLMSLVASDVGRPIRDFSTRFTDESLLEDARQVMELLTPIEKDVKTEGDARFYSRRILPYRTLDGRIAGVVVNLVDITDRKRAEALLAAVNKELAHRINRSEEELGTTQESLIESETRFRLLAENVPGFFCYCDTRERYQFVNNAYAELYQTSPDRIVGRPMREVIGERAYGVARPHIDAVLGGREQVYERPLSVGEEESRWLRVRQVPDRDPQGRTRGFYTLMTEVTNLKRAEKELRSLSARLLTAEEDERRRIARELHDDFSQRLAMLSVEVEAVKAKITGKEAADELDEILERLGSLSDDVHRLAYQLHPSILDHLGLAAALQRALEEFSTRYRIETLFRERGPTREVSTEASICLYRIAQECLTNAARHSGTTRISVRLLAGSSTARLSIRDYGEGFDVHAKRREVKTLGLIGMEERARLLGGTLSIRSSSRGTVVEATCPLAAPQE